MHLKLCALAIVVAACGDNHDGNTAPTVGGLTLTTDEDTSITRSLTIADNEGDPTTLSFSDPPHGTVVAAGADTFMYLPDPDYHGLDAFTVTVSDGTAETRATIDLTIAPVNDAPAGTPDALATMEEVPLSTPAATLLANDTDVDGDTLTVISVSQAVNGNASLLGNVITFNPFPNFSGTASYHYVVSDGTATHDAVVTIAVAAVNDAPAAGDDFVTTPKNTALAIPVGDLLANDFDVDNPAPTITGVALPQNGTVALAGTTITFTPAAGFVGTASFQYTLSDGTLTDTATVTVTVFDTNVAPVANADAVTTDEDTAIVVTQATLIANDTDADAGTTLTVTGATTPVNGTIAFAAGNVTFTPTANVNGTGSFRYTLSDGTATATALVTVTITPVNDAPVAIDDVVTTAEDTAATIAASTLTANDQDIEGNPLAVTAVAGATNGTVALASGNITFTPTTNFHGTASFVYTVSDGTATDTGLVTVTVTAVNDAPVAVADSVTAPGGTPTDFATSVFLANDSDVDLDTLAITAVGNATDGATVALAGTTITFTAPIMFSGVATFEYTLSDGNGGTATGTVSVGVNVTNICGDGAIAGIEACDDGGTTPGDGCSATCTVESGFACAGEPSVCTTTCGDGIPAGTEACDDMNTVNGDGCDNNCTVTGCGNGIVTAGEACDDGDADETDGCTSECSLGVLCNATTFTGGDRFAVDPLTGSCYVAFDGEQTTFAAARSACTAIGGYLATITSAAEQALVRSVQNPAENPWIGGLDDANTTDAVFTWVTAEPFGFTAFDTGEPDDDAGFGGNGDCLHLNPNGQWADTNCTLATFVVGRVCEIETQPCGDGVLQAGEQCDDGNVAAGDGCSTTCKLERAWFSEYVEGSSNNKALEIKNPFSYPINLQACTLSIYFNGATTPTTFALPSAPVPANDVFVVCNNLAGSGLAPSCDLLTNSTTLTFNGDDALALTCGGVVLDVIGQIGNDPGTEWGSANASTADNTIRRKCSVTTGDANGADAFNPATEWVGFANDTFSGIGNPACAP